MEDVIDLEIKGSGDNAGGNYNNVTIKGEGKFNVIWTYLLEIQWRCEVKGNLKAGTVKVKGPPFR